MLRVCLLIWVAFRLTATDAAPAIFLSQDGDGTYLTYDEHRLVLQDKDGSVLTSFHLVKEGGDIVLYSLGRATGAHLVMGKSGEVSITAKDGTHAFSTCAAPPEAIGWSAYVLPAPTSDEKVRSDTAKEVVRRFILEQQLRFQLIKLTAGQMDAATMQRADVAAIVQKMHLTDEDNEQWLLSTIRTSGWIGAKSHGQQASQAVLLISLHNVGHLRLGATVLAQLQAEFQRREINEGSVANMADRLALVMADPLTYGIQAAVAADGTPVIPIIADAAQVDVNRKRIGQPPLASSSAMMHASVLRIGDDGRLVGTGAAAVTGLDGIDVEKAVQDPAWGLAEAAKADPAFAAAEAAAATGEASKLAAWSASAGPGPRMLLLQIFMNLGKIPPAHDSNAAIMDRRPVIEGVLSGWPAYDVQRFILANLLGYALVARSSAPSAAELARAGVLADELEKALKDPNISNGQFGSGMVDTVACVRYRQGRFADAASLWRRAISLSGPQAPEVMHRRLAAAESRDPAVPLPLE